MDRREAMLRELNLYPQWVRRGQPAPVAAQAVAAVAKAVEVSVPVAIDTLKPPTCSASSGWQAGTAQRAQSMLCESPVSPPCPSPASERREIASLDWPELKTVVRDCTACRLRAGCTQTVFGVGDEQADWLFVGEGPGEDEDARGEPFVGQAGKLLDNMLLAINLKRGKKVYIANIVKCRPPGNRNPAADEIATCLPYLERQIALIRPRLIVALGKIAAAALLGREATIGSLRGKLHDHNGIPLMVTYHPAYLLRSPMEKAKAWQDLCLAVETMQEVRQRAARLP